ncbi:intercellular adhesion molecule 1-like [Sphaeramia orbicularis]|uniref:Intercellular adhesion molecule 1-like n=1 Tax=Sphaeramia orbicularis TaxID=375764 RepID=A0A672ZUU5_9TELE|nr:intercellular adhesion molecule 1-like [Sphaeramia orbicularis]
MCESVWPVIVLLSHLFSSAISLPVSIYTPPPPLPSQIWPPSSSSAPSPSLSVLQPTPPSLSPCLLMISPSSLVVRFGDPVKANCSLSQMDFYLLGWENLQRAPQPTQGNFLVWSEDRVTEWSIKPMCYALSDHGGPCQLHLPVTVYKPPEKVSISFVNHTGPMFEGHQYTLQCTVWDVAPVKNLIVRFFRGETELVQLKSINNTGQKPATETFTLDISPSKDDNGAQYWCEAKLDLGPGGPESPPMAKSENITATLLFGPQILCPAKLQVREGERLSCEVRGNPPPLVTWMRDGLKTAPPTHSTTKHAGKYTVLAIGHVGQKYHTVEVEVITGSGTSHCSSRAVVLILLFIQMKIWL